MSSKPKKIPDFLFVHHFDANNVGDRECSPGKHLGFPNSITSSIKRRLPIARTLILGGGEIYGDVVKYAASSSMNKYDNSIVWGVGTPNISTEQEIKKVASSFTHFSTRNYNWKGSIDFVPCASCLSLKIDNLPEPTCEVVLYLHRKKTNYSNFANSPYPVKFNDMDNLRDALEFLASGATIVTNSYHGVYWGQLIGRKVLCIPYGNKFSTFQDTPSMAGPDDWEASVGGAVHHPSRLNEYRTLNLEFMDKVLNI